MLRAGRFILPGRKVPGMMGALCRLGAYSKGGLVLSYRRSFRFVCVVTASFLSAAVIAQSNETLEPSLAKEPLRFVSQPYLQSPLPDSIAVMWLTNKPCLGWVEFGEGDALDRKAVGSRFGLIDAGEDQWRICLTGLKPGTKYSYRIMAKEIERFRPYEVVYGATIEGETRQFTTPGPQDELVSFVVFNDVHSSKKLRSMLFPVAKKEPFDIAFLNGDIMSTVAEREIAVNQMAIPFAELCEGEIPFVLVRGNHEARGHYARRLTEHVATPNGQYYFSFDRGPVHFVVLDSGEDKADSDKEYGGLVDFHAYRGEETEWLKQEVESEAFKSAAFRVGFMHMPMFRSGDGPQDCTAKWAALLNAGKLDVLICGHLHRHEIVEPVAGQHDYPIIIGGGSEAENATVIRGKATPDRLEITIFGANGQTLMGRVIDRKVQQ